MRASLFLCCVLAVLSTVAGQCYSGNRCPTECAPQIAQCTDTYTWPATSTPSGTVCCKGALVWPSDPCCATSTTGATTTPTTAKPATTTTTTKPATTTTTVKPSTTAAPTSSSGCTLSQIFSQADFNALFPNANLAARRGDAGQYAIFTYDFLIRAAASFPAFACTGTLAQRKRELSAFLAQTSQESSGWWSGQKYEWGYVYSTELCAPNCASYVQSDATYPPVNGQNYYGRGPMQLSWNYNYGPASQALYGDKNVLLNSPNRVLTDDAVAFKAALWFWFTAQYNKPSCHDVITGQWSPSSTDTSAGRVAGFGLLTNIINGGIECGVSSTPSSQSVNRLGYYTAYNNYFGISDNTNTLCNTMKSF